MKFMISKPDSIHRRTDADKKGKVGGGRIELLQFSKEYVMFCDIFLVR